MTNRERVERQFAEYTDIAQALYPIAREAGLNDVCGELKRIWLRLRQGPVRVLVLGTTSAGKSTLVNALSGAVIAPEGKYCTSPVPIWVYGRRYEGSDVPVTNIIRRDEGMYRSEFHQGNTFLTDYCYAISDIGDTKNRQQRYAGCEAAEVFANSGFLLDAGITLIDTPGVGTNPCDALRTGESIANGAEAVLLVYSHHPFSPEDKEFLHRLLMGGDGAPARLNIPKPGSLFIVHNPMDRLGGPGRPALCTDITDMLGSAANTDSGLFVFNAHRERLRSAGAYLHLYLLPNLSSLEAQNGAAAAMEREQRLCETEKSRPEQPEFTRLKAALKGTAAAFYGDPNAVCAVTEPLRTGLCRAIDAICAVKEKRVYSVPLEEYPACEELLVQKKQLEDALMRTAAKEKEFLALYKECRDIASQVHDRAPELTRAKIAEEMGLVSNHLRLYSETAVKQSEAEKEILALIGSEGLTQRLVEGFARYRAELYRRRIDNVLVKETGSAGGNTVWLEELNKLEEAYAAVFTEAQPVLGEAQPVLGKDMATKELAAGSFRAMRKELAACSASSLLSGESCAEEELQKLTEALDAYLSKKAFVILGVNKIDPHTLTSKGSIWEAIRTATARSNILIGLSGNIFKPQMLNSLDRDIDAVFCRIFPAYAGVMDKWLDTFSSELCAVRAALDEMLSECAASIDRQRTAARELALNESTAQLHSFLDKVTATY